MKKVLLFWGVFILVIISTANGQIFKLVKDINTTAITAGSDLSDIVAIGNTIYFNAFSPTTGAELWKSNGKIGRAHV